MTVKQLKDKLALVSDDAELVIHTYGSNVAPPELGYQMSDTSQIVYFYKASREVPLDRPVEVGKWNDLHQQK